MYTEADAFQTPVPVDAVDCFWVVHGALEVTVNSPQHSTLVVAGDKCLTPRTLRELGATCVEKITVKKLCKALFLSNADYTNLIHVLFTSTASLTTASPKIFLASSSKTCRVF